MQKKEDEPILEDDSAEGTSTLVVQKYVAEADGYLGVNAGERLVAVFGGPEAGDDCCLFPFYVYTFRMPPSQEAVLVPKEILCERFVNGDGRAWFLAPLSGTWQWEDSLLSS